MNKNTNIELLVFFIYLLIKETKRRIVNKGDKLHERSWLTPTIPKTATLKDSIGNLV